jgi:cysteine desulfurase
LKELEAKGYTVIYIKPDKNGEIAPERILAEIDKETCLLAMMLVNNELGTIFPVKEIFRKAKIINPKISIHCDAVQGFMKIPVKFSEISADTITVSGHKINGIKGVGALIIRDKTKINPQIFGGSQENGYRSGTENVAGIASLGAAVEFHRKNALAQGENIRQLREFLLTEFGKMPFITVNSPQNGSPYIVNVSVKGIRSEIMLHYLESKEIFVSSGSACSKGKNAVLQEFNVKGFDTAVRISLSYENTKEELKTVLLEIQNGYENLIHK